MPRPAGGLHTVFLDRDGTLTVKPPEGEYVGDPAALTLLPHAGSACRRLNDAGRTLVLVTNQRGVARGLVSAAGLDAITARLHALLAADGAHLDAVYVCPHEVGACDCRKPLPGLLLRAAREHPAVRLAGAVTVGDAESDVGAGRAAGTATVRLAAPGTPSAADVVLPDLAAAVDWILAGPAAPPPAGR